MGRSMYSFVKCAGERVNSFTMLEKKRETDGEVLLLDSLRQFHVTLLTESYIRYDDAFSARGRHRGEVPSPPVSDTGVPATSSSFYVGVNGKCSWDPANLKAVD